MALESWILDGLPLTATPFLMMELTANPPAPRAQWVSSAYSEFAGLVDVPQYENREIVMKLRVTPQASMDAALNQIAAIRDKFRIAAQSSDGLQLSWTPNNSTRTVLFYVLDGNVTDLEIAVDGLGRQWFKGEPVFSISMTCKPGWVNATETVTTSATSASPIVTKELTGVGGDLPALGRLIVTDGAAQARRHVEWGIEGPTYDATTSLLLDSDNLVTTGTGGTGTASTGAYDPNAAGNNAIQVSTGPSWTAIAATGNLTHVGTFRVRARLKYAAGTLPSAQARFQWKTAEGQAATNPVAVFPAIDWYDVDLGTVTIPDAISGTQGWSGTVLVSLPGGIAYETITLDYILLIPVTAGYGRVRGVSVSSPGTVVGGDPFTSITVSSALNARTAPLGGAWATSGATGDFAGDKLASPSNSIGQQIVRATVSDASPRWAILGSTNYTNMSVQVLTAPWWETNDSVGVVARWTNSSNYLAAVWYFGRLRIFQTVAGVQTTLQSVDAPVPATRVWRTIRVTVYDTGRAVAELYDGGFPSTDQALSVAGSTPTLRASVETQNATLATGGALATGKPGLYDSKAGAGLSGHWYDDFLVSVPPAEPVALYPSGRTLEIRHDDVIRQDSTGTYYGHPSYRGTRFLVPPGTSRVAVKARRNDVEVAPDTAVTDSTTIQVAYRIRGLVIPRT